ncbi:unnamed protein product [Moneuplotes crassus]|uniref:histidine kinase n=1 Tax=Euplotes crassus TaxID=5936 RepID=A0AAD2D387_EUPCR|nr:unnamed protein product [Moneuplotes crassus]
MIRDNWKALILLFKVLIVIVIVALSIDEQSSSLFVVRTSILFLLFLTCIFFQRIVQKYDWAAKNAGVIFICILVAANTEVNVNLGQYRVYEGFITQIAISFVFSTCVSEDWLATTLILALCYVYYFARMYCVFDNIPHSLKIGLCEAVIFYALAAYLNSRTLQREFCANHKAEESSKDFKQFLKSLPEGVCIIDDDDSQFKFYNLKLRQTLDTSLFCGPDSNIRALEAIKAQINREFEDSQKKIIAGFNESSIANDAFRLLSKDFKVLKPQHKIELGSSAREVPSCLNKSAQSNHFNFYNHPLLVKKAKIGDHNDITLHDFLKQERADLRRQDEEERETKITLYFDEFNHIDGIEMIGREFIIKTRSVSQNDPENPKKCLFLHIFIDTTQITQLEEQRAQNRYQKQMLANVSHEFRTPLNAMSISLILLRKQIKGPPAKLLRIASSSCGILSSLVEDILDHAKIESGVFQVQEEVFRVNKLINEIKDIFELQASKRKIRLTFNLPDGFGELLIKSDKQRIKQVMMNLLSNALKFTDKGAIRVTLEQVREKRQCFIVKEEDKEESKYDTYFNFQNGSVKDKVDSCYESVNQEYTSRPQIPRISQYSCYPDNQEESLIINSREDHKVSESDSDEVNEPELEPTRTLKLKLTVEDTGIGIPLSDQSSLFKLFGKTSSNHNRNKTGCGLGLTICRKILQKLGGDITLESQEGRGTKVTCILMAKY